MSETIRHRGPDDAGEWVDPEVGVALGFRRLAILDLTAEGRQPMLSASGRYVVVFNGEVYNHLLLRRELERQGHCFRGRSDTQVLLAAFEQWGIMGALQRCNGMLACAVWDRVEGRLHLARDRVGKKPLYYGWVGGHFLFASELKAFHRHPAFPAELDRDVLASYFRFGYVPTPRSIFRGIFKLPPATVLSLPATPPFGEGTARPVVYWTTSSLSPQPPVGSLPGSLAHDLDELELLLEDAVRLRGESDVPLGALLSGGVDSSLVAALMQAGCARPIQTFTVGFDERAYDESAAARAVARHLGTDHCELRVTPQQCRDVVPSLARVYDEPFADTSQIPTVLICALAGRQVKVLISGDGGDELFGGYPRYRRIASLWSRLSRVPMPLRRLAAAAIQRVPDGVWMQAASRLLPRCRPGLHVDRARKLAEILAAPGPSALYLRWISHWHDPSRLVVDDGRPPPHPWPATLDSDHPLPSLAERMMYADLVGYLPDDILVKVDRASMAASVEVRAPLLDHRVVEWAWRLPAHLRLGAGQDKWVLRQLLRRRVPAALTDRPKMGFGVPLDDWLRGPLREWAEHLLGESSLRSDGLLQPATIRAAWADHLAGRRDDQFRLWTVLMFQSWRQQWLR